MSYDNSPPPYPGIKHSGLFPNAEGKFSGDEKDPQRLQAEYDSEYPYNVASNLQPDSSRPRPSTAPNSDYAQPSPRNHAAAISAETSNPQPSVIFQVYITKQVWTRELDITINGKTDVAFHVSFSHSCLFSSKPDMTIQRGSASGPVIGTVHFRKRLASRRITQLQFPEAGTSAELERKGWFSCASTVMLEGHMLEWKGTHGHGASKWSCGSLKLVDDSGRIYAVYADKTYKALTKQGRITIEVPGLSDNLIEQIVCSGLALAERERRAQAAGTAAAASA